MSADAPPSPLNKASPRGRGRSTLDLFGTGYTLLAFDERVDTGGLQAAARERGVPLSVVTVTHPDVAEAYARRLVLVRPDGHVCWRADTPPADAESLIGRVAGYG